MQDAQENCAVCLTATVEMKAPLFSTEAWAWVHSRVLSRVRDKFLVGPGIDIVWCRVLEHYQRGCDPRNMLPFKPGGCLSWLGGACAMTYVTPMIDDNHMTLAKDFGRDTCRHPRLNASSSMAKVSVENRKIFRDFRSKCLAAQSSKNRTVYNEARAKQGLREGKAWDYFAMPSWRVARTLFDRRINGGAPGCWSRQTLRLGPNALRGFSANQDEEMMAFHRSSERGGVKGRSL